MNSVHVSSLSLMKQGALFWRYCSADQQNNLMPISFFILFLSPNSLVAYPPWNSHINWIPDPAPLPSRDHGNLNSPSPSRDHGKENLPPQDAPHKLPRKLRPRRRKEKQSGPAANHNSPSRMTGSQPATSGSPGSAMRAPVKHPLTFQRSQHPRLTTNHNSEHRFDQDHPESGRLYKQARSSIQLSLRSH